jgi:hypothetical protein
MSEEIPDKLQRLVLVLQRARLEKRRLPEVLLIVAQVLKIDAHALTHLINLRKLAALYQLKQFLKVRACLLLHGLLLQGGLLKIC